MSSPRERGRSLSEDRAPLSIVRTEAPAPLTDERAANDEWESFCARIGWRPQALEAARSLPVDFEVRLRDRVITRCQSARPSPQRATALAHALEEPAPSSVSGVRERAALFAEMDLDEERWLEDESADAVSRYEVEAGVSADEAPIAIAQPAAPARPVEESLVVLRGSKRVLGSSSWARLASIAAVAALGLGTAATIGALASSDKTPSTRAAARSTSAADAWSFSDGTSSDEAPVSPSAVPLEREQETPSDPTPPSESASAPKDRNPGMLVASLRSSHGRRGHAARPSRARTRDERPKGAEDRVASATVDGSGAQTPAPGAVGPAGAWSDHDAAPTATSAGHSGATLLRRARAASRTLSSPGGEVIAVSAAPSGEDTSFRALEGPSFSPPSDAGREPLGLSLPRANGSWYGFALPPASEPPLGPSGMGVMAQFDLGRALRVE